MLKYKKLKARTTIDNYTINYLADGNAWDSKTIAINIPTPELAERLASCWNACINLEHPESDLKKILEGQSEQDNLQ